MKFRMFCAALAGAAALAAGLRLLAGVSLLWLLAEALAAAESCQRDSLTKLKNLRGLSNDRHFWEKAKQVTVFYLDVDNLKQLNDSQGHRRGNEALAEVGRALASAAGPDARGYRIGGDEFLLIAKGETLPLAARWETLEKSLALASVSWGAATGPGQELDQLLDTAEEKMYGKRKRRNGLQEGSGD